MKCSRVFPAVKAGVYFTSFDYRMGNCKKLYATFTFTGNSELIELTMDLILTVPVIESFRF